MPNLPDSVIFSTDPAVQAKLATPEGYRELVTEYSDDPPETGTPAPEPGQAGAEPPHDPPEPVTDDPPATPAPATDPPPSAATPSEGDAIFTEAETRKLIRLGIIDEKGQFLGKYSTPEKLLEAVAHKDKVISSKFSEYLKANPDEAKALLVDTGVVGAATPPPASPPAADAGKDQPPNTPEHMPGQQSPQPPASDPNAAQPAQPQQGPTPDVDSIIAQTLPLIDQILAEEFKDDLADLGVGIPTDRKGWRDLFDMAPGIASDLRDRHDQLSQHQQALRATLQRAAGELQARREQRPAYEQQLLERERAELVGSGYPEALVTSAQEELLARRASDANVDLTYYDDEDQLGNRLYAPVIKQGALRSFLLANHSDAVMSAQIDAKVQEKLSKQQEWRQSKERRAALFPPTIVGATGEGKTRTAATGLQPTPSQYWDQSWRDQNLRTEEARRAVRDWIAGLPDNERATYRNPG